MSDNLTKAYEVSYALFRLASQMQEKDFAEQLRMSGAALLSATAGEDYAAAGQSLHVMECLVKFAGDVNLIGTANSDVLLREIYALDAAIAESRKTPKTDQLNVAEIFSNPEVAEPQLQPESIRQPATASTPEKHPAPHPLYEREEKSHEASATAEQAPQNISTILKSAIRQTAILDKVRQSGNCRLKDIQEVLPDASERTIRYDLQTLLEQDLIERVGIAGPSVYYRAKQSA